MSFVNHSAIEPDYGKVWYDNKAIANIFSIANLVKKYMVNYDSNIDNYFTFHTNRVVIKFRSNKQVLYVFNTRYNTAESNIVITVRKIWWYSQADKYIDPS